MSRDVNFQSHAKPTVDWRLRALVIGFVAYVAGGLYFGYIFVSIAVGLLELQTGADLPNPPAPPLVVVAASSPAPAAPQPLVLQPTAGGRVNVLLLGLDQRPVEDGQPSRSDTMIVATIEPRSQTAALLSIPRDLWVTIPNNEGGVINNKINTAHFFGQAWRFPDGKNPNGGPELAKRTVEYNLGIPIHYYARIDFKGFEKAVDLVDGIDVDVPTEIIDTEYPLENDTGVTTVRFPAGRQHMDGQTALRYARTRHADSDFGRMARQRQVLLALRDKALRLDVLPRLPQLLGVLRDSLDTDMPLDQMLNLANIVRGIKAEAITSHAIDAKIVVPDQPVYGALLPKLAEIQKLVTKVFFDPVLKEEAARLEVQNGTAHDGLATAWAQALEQRGFSVARFRQAEQTTYGQTEIWSYAGKDYTVRQLATVFHVGAAQIHNSARPAGSDVDIRIVLGNNAAEPPS
ncbi:MAG: LCP family protein [Chloroflexi bacterium]|nr:LCP family protein [Chloroflexota bacterium]